MKPLLVVAGEASGDLHAARLLAELRTLRPEVEPFGLGGDELAATGLAAVGHSREVAVVGITEALKVLPRARRLFRLLLAEVDRRRPTVALLVDFPEFNLRLARELRRRGVAVAYYISPQVWAWRRGRVRAIARDVDAMLVLFPFEDAFFRGHGVEVEHVGHPLVDEVPRLPQRWDRTERDDAARTVALLPGSRASEVQALLPVMLQAGAALAAAGPVSLRLIQAPTVPPALIEGALAAATVPVERVTRDRFVAIADAHLALCASGTATLEVGLLGTPLVVLYRLHAWSYLLGKALVDLPSFSLVNLVLGEPVVPELLQRDANPRRIAAEARRLLDAPAAAAMRRRLGDLRPRLGAGGASARAARAVARLLDRQGGATALDDRSD